MLVLYINTLLHFGVVLMLERAVNYYDYKHNLTYDTPVKAQPKELLEMSGGGAQT